MDIPILWEDEALLAVNKPAGLRTIADGYNPSLPNLQRLLSADHGRLWVVHRLDKDTSGVIVFALSAEAHRDLNRQFERRETRKEYHALVRGVPAWEEREIDLPLRVDGDRKHRTVIDPTVGKPASTTCRVIRRLPPFCLLSAFPHTGYTHQIRAHLAAVGLPLVADPLYQSLRPEDRGLTFPDLPIMRTALHARQIAFVHPVDGSPIVLQAPYPQDLQEALHILGGVSEAGYPLP